MRVRTPDWDLLRPPDLGAALDRRNASININGAKDEGTTGIFSRRNSGAEPMTYERADASASPELSGRDLGRTAVSYQESRKLPRREGSAAWSTATGRTPALSSCSFTTGNAMGPTVIWQRARRCATRR